MVLCSIDVCFMCIVYLETSLLHCKFYSFNFRFLTVYTLICKKKTFIGKILVTICGKKWGYMAYVCDFSRKSSVIENQKLNAKSCLF